MKNEPQATPSAHVFQTVREIEANARSRMEKALSDLQHDMAAVRTGRASVSLRLVLKDAPGYDAH